MLESIIITSLSPRITWGFIAFDLCLFLVFLQKVLFLFKRHFLSRLIFFLVHLVFSFRAWSRLPWLLTFKVTISDLGFPHAFLCLLIGLGYTGTQKERPALLSITSSRDFITTCQHAQTHAISYLAPIFNLSLLWPAPSTQKIQWA